MGKHQLEEERSIFIWVGNQLDLSRLEMNQFLVVGFHMNNSLVVVFFVKIRFRDVNVSLIELSFKLILSLENEKCAWPLFRKQN